MLFNQSYYLNKLIPFINNGNVKVITGPRRVGKSYFLFNIFPSYLKSNGISDDQIIKINLEDYANQHLRNLDALYNEVLRLASDKHLKYYILIDEIQMCSSYLNPYNNDPNYPITFVDVLNSFRNISNYDVYVTGSNSKMLSKDVLTTFRGRSNNIEIFPLAFCDIYNLYPSLDEAFSYYLRFGGMPEVYSISDSSLVESYLTDLYSLTYIRDVIERYNLANKTSTLEVLLKVIASSVGSLTNPLKLANTFKSKENITIASNTIANYLTHFEDAFVLRKVERFDVKGKHYIASPYKYYYSDVGIRNAVLGFKQIEEIHLIENIVYNELIRRGFNVDVGVVFKEEYQEDGSKTKKSYEVDFVAKKFSKLFYIQVALSISLPAKLEQERKSLLNINDHFLKIVIVKNLTYSGYDENGIFYLDLYDFLLERYAKDLLF